MLRTSPPSPHIPPPRVRPRCSPHAQALTLAAALLLPLLWACGDGGGATEPQPGPEPFRFLSVSAGGSHTCAMGTAEEGRGVYCWGASDKGQLGDGSGGLDAFTPRRVSGDLDFEAVSAGKTHTCALTTDGTAYCWGGNDHGQLGTGSTGGDPIPEPVAVEGGLTFEAISAGGDFTCAVTPDGEGYCWGKNYTGQLGNGGTSSRSTPAPIDGDFAVEAISAGTSGIFVGHTLAVAAGDVGLSWGGDNEGQIGRSAGGDCGAFPCSRSPEPISLMLSFARVSAGLAHSCGVTPDGAAYCWGRNNDGQLGDGGLNERSSPAAVEGGLSLQAVAAGDLHTCGLTTGGEAWCWGLNTSGQLGDGVGSGESNVPVAVEGGVAFSSISAGERHTCGVTADGEAFCWGRNANGQLGDGGQEDATVPVQVAEPGAR